MNIAVCVKEVPSATSQPRLDPGTKRLDRSGDSAEKVVAFLSEKGLI